MQGVLREARASPFRVEQTLGVVFYYLQDMDVPTG
jgi:hypothetical protein